MARRPARFRSLPPRTVLLGALCTAAVVLFSILVPVQAVRYGTVLPLSFILAAALCAAPLLALARPRWAIAMFSVASLTLHLVVPSNLASESPWPWSVPALLVFVLFVGTVTFVHGARLGAFPLVIGSVLSLAAPLLRPDIAAGDGVAANVTANLVVTASVAVAVYLIAALLAGRQRVTAELSREREHSALEESRRALVEERTRIARELHDVIAHSMSVIQVQASTARYRLSGIDESSAAEFDSIAATARSSLTEMRRMLGVLRTEDTTAELAPQQRIDDVPGLVDTIRRAGAVVGLEITGPTAAAPATVQIAAYRIVQEALSNAMRHAVGAAITVRMRVDDTSVGIVVHNDCAAAPASPTGSGHGLRGMRERVELLGGAFRAGTATDGGWDVVASLPLQVPSTLTTPPVPEETA